MERMGKLGMGVILLLSIQGALLPRTAFSNPLRHASVEALTTYHKFLPRALDNDTDIQYLLGFMFLHGEGVEKDYSQAHQWFHLAANGGHRVAQRLLGNLHARIPSRVPDYFHDPAEARHWSDRANSPVAAGVESKPAGSTQPHPLADTDHSLTLRLREGEAVYTTFCAGCHGLNGIAYYVDSPSFALREQLHKSDDELLETLKSGKGEMPNWDDKLSERKLRAAITFIRNLAPAYEAGISGRLHQPAGNYFLFKTAKKKGTKWPEEASAADKTENRQ